MMMGRDIMPSLSIIGEDYGVYRKFSDIEVLYLIALELRAARTGDGKDADEFWKHFIREEK